MFQCVCHGYKTHPILFPNTLYSTGVPDKIQISSATAALLVEAGKQNWMRERTDGVSAKGKGILSTYWLILRPPRTGSTGSAVSTDLSSLAVGTEKLPVELPFATKTSNKKLRRLVNWVTDMLLSHAREVIARHEALEIKPDPQIQMVYHTPRGKTCLDEAVDVIKLPDFDETVAAHAKSADQVIISPNVAEQFRRVVTMIASSYQENAFHNFEHACHVTMSVDKFLQRIVAPDIDAAANSTHKTAMASHLHDYTHGITSDPLTILAIVFSALVHDADHRGVSNQQLGIEEAQMADKYKSKSIAEQHSLDITWSILMRDEFAELRSTVFATRSELLRFRQVVVNVVLATDIFDKELNDKRKNRWKRAFDGKDKLEDEKDVRATIVIEHIIQASDVSHTMQHWHVYRKWNERLFMEMSAAFRAGRMGKDPAEFWYNGEIGFFDNYIVSSCCSWLATTHHSLQVSHSMLTCRHSFSSSHLRFLWQKNCVIAKYLVSQATRS